jgi:dTDP-glucose pyrophosphorylase
VRYLIPIASPDDLFPRAEFHYPKPLIEIDGEPMISRVVDNLRQSDPTAEFIFVVQARDCREFSLDRSLNEITNGRCKIVRLEQPTLGSACSVLMAVDLIDDDEPVVVCNGDQIIEGDLAVCMRRFQRSDIDAGIITFSSVHPRWSYVRLSADGLVTEAAEKRVISRTAIAGFYYFRRGAALVSALKSSILNERSVDGRYFIAPVLNEFVLTGDRIVHCSIDSEQYQSLFSPQRLTNYERQITGRRVTGESAQTSPSLTVVIPMAGLGSRFSKAGYEKPKPFIDVDGVPMIGRVMDNLHVPGAHYVLIARREHLEQEPEVVRALEARGNVTFAAIDLVTEGAACTVMTARKHIPMDVPLLIANCDQIVDFDCADYFRDAVSRHLDGSILCFKDPSRNTKWSFARVDGNGLVTEVKEKVAISDLATVGLYHFAKARSFFDAAIDMISRNERVNNEFYVCPLYNYSIATGLKIGVYEVKEADMHGIGTPEDLNAYLAILGA